MGHHDLRVTYADYENAILNLDTIITSLESNTQSFTDLGSAVGHNGLACSLKQFSENWRIKRGWMVEQLQACRDEIDTNLQAWKDADAQLGDSDDDHDRKRDDNKDKHDDQDKHDDPDNKEKPDPTPDQPVTPSTGGGGGGGSGSGTGGSPNINIENAVNVEQNNNNNQSVNVGTDPVSSPDDPTTTPGTDTGEIPLDPMEPLVVGSTLGAIYAIWQRIQNAKANGTDTGPDADLPLSDRIKKELAEMGIADDDVEITVDPKDPDDIIAVLKGEDGSVITTEFDDGDGDPQLGGGEIGIDDPVATPSTSGGTTDAGTDTGSGLGTGTEGTDGTTSADTGASSGGEGTAATGSLFGASADGTATSGEGTAGEGLNVEMDSWDRAGALRERLAAAEAEGTPLTDTDLGDGSSLSSGGSGGGGGGGGGGSIPLDDAASSSGGSFSSLDTSPSDLLSSTDSSSDWADASSSSFESADSDGTAASAGMGMAGMGAMAGMGRMGGGGGSYEDRKERLKKPVEPTDDKEGEQR
ncbi:MAG: hypothetical protein LBR20_03425 [Propionibacteriaceae bacterium]|jgi:hypothetical protein|nr:hypothetical protein [Propionibacteriaceae bacterium]